MPPSTNLLPLTETTTPADEAAVAAAVAGAYEAGTPVYPIGGATQLDLGPIPAAAGLGLSTANLNRVVDYPADDLTITAEAGLTIAALAEHLNEKRQRLPIDVPWPKRATLGGIVATGADGPRRYGLGTIRDYVIGIRAVDGQGNVFAAGGRVVKNAAGYDLCRLLTGSLGTLAVITRVTLRVKPLPETSAWMAVDVADLATAERLLAELVDTRTQPMAIELLVNASLPEQRVPQLEQRVSPSAASVAGRLFVGFEGTDAEVRWMTEQLHDEWKRSGAAAEDRFTGADAETVSAGLVKHFYRSAGREADSLTVRIATMPGALTGVIGALLAVDPAGSIQAHAGDGMVLFRTSAASRDGTAAFIDGRLRPIATEAGGYLTVQSAPAGAVLSRETVWGPPDDTAPVMRRIKQKFDPKNLLNPGRFVYE